MIKSKSTELATIPSKEELQNNLNNAIKVIDKKLKSLGLDTTYVYKAQPHFKMNELDQNTVNIQQCTNLNYLIFALARVITLKRDFEEIVRDLKISTVPIPTYLNISLDFWISDLTYRIKLVSNQSLIAQLTQKRTELTTFLSSEQRLFETLKSTSELLK